MEDQDFADSMALMSGGDTPETESQSTEEAKPEQSSNPEQSTEAENTEGAGSPDKEAEDSNAQAEKEAEAQDTPDEKLPEEFEPYKNLIDSRKLDVNDPKGMAKEMLKAYDNLNRETDRTKTQIHNTKEANKAYLQALTGSVADINAARKMQGLPEIQAAKSWDEQSNDLNDLYNSVDAALKGDEQALQKLNERFTKEREAIIAGKAADGARSVKSSQDISKAAAKNYQTAISENPEIETYMNEVAELVAPGGALSSLGITADALLADSQRLQSVAKIGEALHAFNNMESIVEKRVKAEVSRVKRAGSIPTPGGKSPSGQTDNKQNNVEASDAFMMSLVD